MISWRWGIYLLVLLLSTTGCGVKGALVQKGKPLPAAPVAATVQQQGGDALLSWTLPTVNQDGSALIDLQRFIITRLPYLPDNYCDECRDPETGQIQIYLDRPAPAFRSGDRFYLRDPGLPIDSGYRYRIVAVTSREEASSPAQARRVMIEPPQPPVSVLITAHDRSLRIDWTAEPQQPAKGQLLGVNIYRALADEPLPQIPINTSPVKETHYDDFNLVNDQSYRYRLRSVFKIDEQLIESAFSETISATPSPGF